MKFQRPRPPCFGFRVLQSYRQPRFFCPLFIDKKVQYIFFYFWSDLFLIGEFRLWIWRKKVTLFCTISILVLLTHMLVDKSTWNRDFQEWTDIATYILNQPRGLFSKKCLSTNKFSIVTITVIKLVGTLQGTKRFVKWSLEAEACVVIFRRCQWWHKKSIKMGQHLLQTMRNTLLSNSTSSTLV